MPVRFCVSADMLQGYWQVKLDSVAVNNNPVASLGAIDSIIDTGTTLILGNPEYAFILAY